MINIKEYYECECGCSILRVEHEHDTDYCGDCVYVSIYNRYHVWTIIHRLRLIWQIIRTGTPYSDEVVLSIDDAKRLGKDLTDNLKDIRLMGDDYEFSVDKYGSLEYFLMYDDMSEDDREEIEEMGLDNLI